jgi:CubicO group peptidase (beta-lactamase class C family)
MRGNRLGSGRGTVGMRRFKAACMLALLVLVLGVNSLQAAGFWAGSAQHEPPLRVDEPVDEVVADLESFVPEYMDRQVIPGAAIALIRDGKIVWTEGYGVANTITRRPVTADTSFELASNDKVLRAYIALQLVDQGILSLDEPLNSYLQEPWLPPSEYRDAITLRHVLSHTSGLGHLTASRESLFAPGRGYSYSAVGFLYLQAVLEEVTGQPMDELAREMVFEPLGMHSSSFLSHAGTAPSMANGHLHALAPGLLFVVPFALALILVGLIGLVIVRLRTGQWRPSRRAVLIILVAAFVLALVPAVAFFVGSGLPEFAWLFVLCAVALAALFALGFLAARAVIVRLLPGRRRLQAVLMIVWSTAMVVALGLLAGRMHNLPVPRGLSPNASAAGSFRATASDLATFLIELAEPQLLTPETAAQLRSSQAELSPDLYWGLGPGIQHSQQGDAIWQWGQHLHFQSVMIVYPEQGMGVVVCTNNDLFSPEVAIEIAHRALGGKIEPIRRQAVGLEYNYREGD